MGKIGIQSLIALDRSGNRKGIEVQDQQFEEKDFEDPSFGEIDEFVIYNNYQRQEDRFFLSTFYLMELHNAPLYHIKKLADIGIHNHTIEIHNNLTWDCSCKVAQGIMERFLMAEVLTKEEMMEIFNKAKKISFNSTDIELVEKRNQLMKAVATIQMEIQAVTVTLNDRESERTTKQKKEIREHDIRYKPPVPKLDKKESVGDPAVDNWLATLPADQRKIMRQTIGLIGLEAARNMMPKE